MLFLTSQLPFSAKIFSRPLPPPKKSSSSEREYLRISEVKAMMSAAKKVGRHGVRDAAIILLMFRHGLRTAELVALKWSQIDLVGGYIEVRRAKHGHDSIHPLRSPELRALRQILKSYPDTQYVFVSERRAPLSTRSIRHIVARAGELAGIPLMNGSSPSTAPRLWLLWERLLGMINEPLVEKILVKWQNQSAPYGRIIL